MPDNEIDRRNSKSMSRQMKELLKREECQPISRERVLELAGVINNKNRTKAERDAAKNKLILAQARLILKFLVEKAAGRIEEEPRASGLFDSAYAYLFNRGSNIAVAVEKDWAISTVVMQRLRGWLGDKVRKQETIKRGKGFTRQPEDKLAEIEEKVISPEDLAILKEFLDVVHDNVTDVISRVSELSADVILCYFGIDGDEDPISLSEIARQMDLPIRKVNEAHHEGMERLRAMYDAHSDSDSDDQ
ncbi:MAG: sigma factor-like helix-turn-helix DNA-binding protein [Pirellula sp.]